MDQKPRDAEQGPVPILDFPVVSDGTGPRIDLVPEADYIEDENIWEATGPDFEYDPDSDPIGRAVSRWTKTGDDEWKLMDATLLFTSTDNQGEPDSVTAGGLLKKKVGLPSDGVVGVKGKTGRFKGRPMPSIHVRIQNPKRWSIEGGG